MADPARSTRLRRMSLTVLVLGAITIAMTIVGAGLVIWLNRQEALAQWRNNLSNMAVVISEHARQSLKSADLVLKGITDRVNELGVEDDKALREVMGSRAIFDMLRDKASGVPQIDVATIVAGNGDVVNFTRSYPPPPINLADRDYFKAHLADPGLDSLSLIHI